MRSKTIVVTAPYKAELMEIDVPAPKPEELLVRTLYTGVSTGTETRVLIGKQAGGHFPLVPGYENIGIVTEKGKNSAFNEGDIVFHTGSSFTGKFNKCWGAHQEYTLVSEKDVFSVPLDLDPIDGIYAKVGAIALHGIKRAGIGKDDTAAVKGLGLIGNLAMQCARAYGVKVIGIDMDEERLNMAKAAGCDYLINASKEDVKARVHEYSDGGVDAAIDVTGIPETLMSTADLARPMPWSPPYPPSPRVVVLGSYAKPITLDYDPLFMSETDILFSRDVRPDDIKEMISLLADGKVSPKTLNAKCFDVSEVQAAYQQMVDEKLMRILFKW